METTTQTQTQTQTQSRPLNRGFTVPTQPAAPSRAEFNRSMGAGIQSLRKTIPVNQRIPGRAPKAAGMESHIKTSIQYLPSHGNAIPSLIPIASNGKIGWVSLKPLKVDERGYAAGSDGKIYSFYSRGGYPHWDGSHEPRARKWKKNGRSKAVRCSITLRTPLVTYDVAELIADAWNIEGKGNVVGFKNNETTDTRPINLVRMSRGEYMDRQHYMNGKPVRSFMELREDDIYDIRSRYDAGQSIFSIARLYHVYRWAVRRIARRLSYAYLPEQS